MAVAHATAKRATCLRRQVGCVLLDADGFILSTGVNGVASGQPHCNEPGGRWPLRSVRIQGELQLTNYEFPNACPAAFAESGTMLDGCHAIHAEQNALLRCPDVRRIHDAFTTTSPCMTCVKLLMNTSCLTIYFAEPYPHNEAETLWRSMGRDWIHLSMEQVYAPR
jgi:dCMP deaminase